MRKILYFVLLISLFGSLNSFAVEIQKTENKKVDDIFDEEDYRSILAKWHNLEILDEEDIESASIESESNEANKEHDQPSLPDLKTLNRKDIDADKIEHTIDNTTNVDNKEYDTSSLPTLQDFKTFDEEKRDQSSLPKLPDLKTLSRKDIDADKIEHTVDNTTNVDNKEHDTSSLPTLQDFKTFDEEKRDQPSLPKLPDLKTLDEKTLDKIDRHPMKPVDDKKSLEEKQERDTQKSTEKVPSEIDLNKKPNAISPPAPQELQKKQNSDPSNADNNATNLPKADQKTESELTADKVPQNKENTYKIDSQKKNTKRLEKPIVAKPKEENKQKKLQQWSELKKNPTEEWTHKNTQNRLIYKRQYDILNEHLPTPVFIHDYSKQFFYCIKKNNLSCLQGIMNKLEKIGLKTEESLKLRNKLGDTPLIYAVKCGEIDIVRFLLLQGADLNAVNYNFQSAMNIAITKRYVNVINAIAEMTPRLVEHKRINNTKDSTMYNWAINTKEDNESKCDADY